MKLEFTGYVSSYQVASEGAALRITDSQIADHNLLGEAYTEEEEIPRPWIRELCIEHPDSYLIKSLPIGRKFKITIEEVPHEIVEGHF